MPGCSYVCPACNDLGFDEQGNKCHWCSPIESAPVNNLPKQIEDAEWMQSVHNGHCCSDIGREDKI